MLTDLNTEKVPTAFGSNRLLFFLLLLVLLGVNLLQHILEGFEHRSDGDGEQGDAHDAQRTAEDFAGPGEVYLSPLPPQENGYVEHGVGDAAESVPAEFVVLMTSNTKKRKYEQWVEGGTGNERQLKCGGTTVLKWLWLGLGFSGFRFRVRVRVDSVTHP